jgi:hypothetical protein
VSSARCIGLWWLFDSTNPTDHANAKTLCAGCPMRRECAETATRFARGTGGALVIEGTWAGKLYGRPKVGRWPCWRDAQAVRKGTA